MFSLLTYAGRGSVTKSLRSIPRLPLGLASHHSGHSSLRASCRLSLSLSTPSNGGEKQNDKDNKNNIFLLSDCTLTPVDAEFHSLNTISCRPPPVRQTTGELLLSLPSPLRISYRSACASLADYFGDSTFSQKDIKSNQQGALGFQSVQFQSPL